MTKLFGEQNPDLRGRPVAKIFAYFDSRTLLSIASVAREWEKEISQRKQVHKEILQKCNLFANITLDNFECHQLSGGLTNTTFKITVRGVSYAARLPGKETSHYINRENEFINASIASNCGINPTIVYCDRQQGTQLTTFLENPKSMTVESLRDPEKLKACVRALRELHQSNKKFANNIDVFARNENMRTILVKHNFSLSDYDNVETVMRDIYRIVFTIDPKKVPCHNDTTPANFVLSQGKMSIIDWEYSGNNYALWDLVCLAMEAEFDKAQIDHMLNEYYDFVKDKNYHMFFVLLPVYEYWVSLWACVQIANNNQPEENDKYIAMKENRLTHCLELLKSTEFIQAMQNLQGKKVEYFQHLIELFKPKDNKNPASNLTITGLSL